MNRIKRFCALLLALVLVLGVVIQPGIGGVFAEDAEQTEQVAEPTTEPTMEPTTEPASTLEPTTEPASTPEPTEADTLLKEELPKEQDEHVLVICPECGVAGGHGETCSQYKTEDDDYVWASLTDTELAAWLMDGANADAVKAILSSDGEEYDALHTRIETILSGEDEELAQKLQEYLSELMGMDEAETLAVPNEYIYFDLAAGDVNIGGKTYSGKIYVDGEEREVTGNHAADNKYYVYQSTAANRKTTGYEKETDYDNQQNCRVPVYDRVRYEGKLWTAFVENNDDVKEVSTAWETAAVASKRTPTGDKSKLTGNRIIFASASAYTADVTIDNIWTYYQKHSAGRQTGGITAHLGYNTETEIRLRLKGDNRVGNVHYYARENKKNQIIFFNGEDADQKPGSITVADFPENFKANFWCSAIGGNDDGCDPADGIVIDSGVIYAGTTSADDCTAIGGGGNEFGRVTISGGTVTAVSASTGTAIGGGIGWSSYGGDADVTISNGTVYAYNHGIGPDSGSYVSFVPAAAIGGGSASTNNGNKRTDVTITGGTVYAQSVGGTAIGGGGSGTKNGGSATVNIKGGTVIAKSVSKTVNYNLKDDTTHVETVPAGVSIGGGTGFTGGGSVTLNISEDMLEETFLRTGSIGGGDVTGLSGTIGNATVTITGGDVTGQVIMAGTGDESKKCSFTMEDGNLHDTNVIHGNTITDIADPNQDAKIEYIQEDGGAVWMDDPIGVANISGGTIERCTANLGGAIYMKGGTFTLSGTGTISGNTAEGNYSDNTGRGGGVCIYGGNANISGGTIVGNTAKVRGGGLYVNGGEVTVSGGLIQGNIAGMDENISTDVGRGGGVYLEGGLFTMKGGDVSGNTAKYRGGGIFLTKKPVLTKGTISNNSAADSGGGICVNGDAVELGSAEMEIFGNHAENGGGVAVLNGNFILSGGAVGVENGISDENSKANTATKGGGVYVANDTATSTGGSSTASVIVNSGNVWYNSATDGGGVYLESGNFTMKGETGVTASIQHNTATEDGGGVYLKDGQFTMNEETASISHNSAKNGGGIYLYTNPDLFQGTIAENTATENGGGMYIEDCLVTLNPTGTMTIIKNGAKNGAGIFIHGVSVNPAPTPVPDPTTQIDAVSSATVPPPTAVGLLVGAETSGTLVLTNNSAGSDGGAVCINAADAKSRFELDTDHITVTGNHAENGGGVAVLNGNFTMTNGSIGEKDGANTATNGGGVYVSGGQVWLRGGSVQYNTATNGGGAYVTGDTDVTGDQFIMIDGALVNNAATENGGGGYVAGNFKMLGGTIGGGGGGNRAKNGGGVYVSEGDATVVYGDISHNHATGDGGGFHVSAADREVHVVMLSGSLSSNQADANGGGMAVESTNNNKITVEIGCLLDHVVKDGSPTLPIVYEGAYNSYAHYDGKDYTHKSCPVVKHNQAGAIGGGFYMNSGASTLSFYCVEETENKAKGMDTAGMDVVGGRVVIGDEAYHNWEYTGKAHGVPWGYVSMDDGTLVNGGQVDIYGDMSNPIFREEVTVDIKDTKNDHFMDHRRAHDQEQSYKVHYIENFFGTGLYQAVQYDEGNTKITIEGALYNRPGYQILGWCTQPERIEGDPDNYYYEVGTEIDLAGDNVPGMGTHSINCEICGENEKDSNLLELYAIWEANGYTVVFDPNVSQGDTYIGSMEDQVFQYGVEQPLTRNAYKYQGYFFAGWNTKADGSGNAYQDGHIIGRKNDQEDTNLTDKNGVKVVLYAQWDPCDHTVPERWSYEVKPDAPETLWRICSCGGQTLTATLSAEDTVYDGNPHPATLALDDKDAWGNDAPEIVYEGNWLEDGLTHADDSPNFTDDNKPYHAGRYTASIAKTNGETPVTALTQYTIIKADQDAPEKPEYTVEGNQLTITRVANDPRTFQDSANYSHTAKVQYHLSHYSGSELTATEWQTIPDGNSSLAITMQTAWTSYYVEARYEELEDYNASEVVRADAVYHYAGDVEVKIICDEGIDAYFEPQLEHDGRFNGAMLTLTTKPGYYTVGGEYEVSATQEDKNSSASSAHPIDKVGNGGKKYSVNGVPDNSILTITIGKARKKPVVVGQVAPRQKFSPITDTTTAISRDSAFTAAFQISNYDPYYTHLYESETKKYGVYDGLELTFASVIPANTTIILLDRRDSSYWYYRAESDVNSVLLTDFKKMGGGGNYVIPHPAPPATPDTPNGYIDLSYQFIVDFSQSGGYAGNGLTMTLEAPVKDAATTKAPALESAVDVSMVNPTFSLESTADGFDSLTQSLKCTYTVDAAASKWENRASALILTPKAGIELPPDARIKAEVSGGTTYLYKSGNSFIIPLSLLTTEAKTANLTLQSALFPAERASYPFAAEWRISPSKAGKAPISGDSVGLPEGGGLEVTFTSAERKIPSLKSEGQDRILTSGDTLKLDIRNLNMDGYTISAALLHKAEDETYNGTGWNKTNVSEQSSLNVPLGGQAPGSFCLMLTVKEKDSVTIVMEVPYYFVIKPTQ